MEEGQLGKIQNGKINKEIEFKSSEVREGQILFDLEEKAKTIDSLSKLIGKVENGSVLFEVISNFLNDIYKKDPETYQGLLKYYALIREYKQLEKISEHNPVLQKKTKDMFVKLNALYSDEKIQFLGVLSEGVAMLKKKYDGIKGIGGDEAVKNLLEKTLFPEGENKLERKSIKDIKVSAFGVDVIVEKEYFKILINIKESEKDIKRNIKAFHQPDSFFSIYSEEKDIEDSRRHERVHNILKGFFPPIMYPLFLIKNRFFLLDKPGDIEQIEQIKQTILSFSPSECVNLLHEEMFANIERIEGCLFSDSSISFINEERRKGFGTAGNEIFYIENFLGERFEKEHDKEIKKFCVEFSEKIDKKFNEVASVMRRVLFIGNKLELEKQFMVHSFLAMLKPTKFHHIETYLKSQCGKERYEGYVSIYGILFEETISLKEKGLRSLLAIKKEIPENLKEQLREKILKHKEEFEHSFPNFALDEEGQKEQESFSSVIKEFYLFLGIE